MRAKLHFPKRKVVERGKTGQEGKRQLTQDRCLAGNGTEAHPGLLAPFTLPSCREISRTIAYWELFIGGSAVPNPLTHTIFYGESLYLWKTEKVLTCVHDEGEVHFVLAVLSVEDRTLWPSFIHSVTPKLELTQWHITHSFVCQSPWRLYIFPLYFSKVVLYRATHQRSHLLR